MSNKIACHGWLPDLPDQRDHLYAAPVEMPGAQRVRVDLRPHCPPVYDHGQPGSCTANAIAGVNEFDRPKQELPDFVPSRLFIYYNERAMEHTIDSDSGAQIRDGKWFNARTTRNSRWGLRGYFTLPYAYVTDDDLASDFWTIRVVQ